MDSEFIIGICDDNRDVHEEINVLLKEYESERNTDVKLLHYCSAEELIKADAEMTGLLLDIEMPGMDGIELGRYLRRHNKRYKIVVLSGREDRMKEAFRINTYDFVSKPIDKGELFSVIDRVRKQLVFLEKVKVYKDRREYEITQGDIEYIERNNSSTLIYAKSQTFRSDRSLADWLTVLDKRIFFQCHRSYIVNMNYIENILDTEVKLLSGYKAKISKKAHSELMKKYRRYDIDWR